MNHRTFKQRMRGRMDSIFTFSIFCIDTLTMKKSTISIPSFILNHLYIAQTYFCQTMRQKKADREDRKQFFFPQLVAEV